MVNIRNAEQQDTVGTVLAIFERLLQVFYSKFEKSKIEISLNWVHFSFSSYAESARMCIAKKSCIWQQDFRVFQSSRLQYFVVVGSDYPKRFDFKMISHSNHF